jgi:hypothetical protein
MKLYDLIKSNNWLSVELTLLQLYPDQVKMIYEYRKVFENLKNIEPKESKMRIVLTEHDCDPDDESEINTYVDVSGQDDKKDENGRIISYALEFTEWKKWLGMDISSETLKNFSELEIIAHCLYEMTFIGYDEEEIQEERKSLDKTIDEYKNLTEEEKKQRTISLEDLIRQLEDKKGSSEQP